MEHASGLVAQWLPGFDPTSDTFVLPLWATGLIAGLFLGFFLLALARAGRDGMVGALARAAHLLIGAAGAWAVLGGGTSGNLASERQALDRRSLEMTSRALLPGSALACLDAAAGDAVEASCEKALFATPESTAAAVSYVAAQISLLVDASDYVRRGGAGYESTIAVLRHAVELDRYGIAAHVFAARDGCTADQCGPFALLTDSSKLVDNLISRRYESYVVRHAAEWPPSGLSPVAVNMPATALTPTPTAIQGQTPAPSGKPAQNNLFFPSSSSIPPVSIMSAEPGGSGSGAADNANAKPPATPRKPAPTQQQARRPTNITPPTQTRPTPTPAPAAAADDN
jgi:hypothetical protein